MIRQAISCDICGTEKRQTNHWFVAYEQAGELRVSGWTSRHRLRTDSKHLCGQTCLHKLVDEFMAKSIASRPKPVDEEADVEPASVPSDTSLTSACEEIESSARLLTPAQQAPPRPEIRSQADVVSMPAQLFPETRPPIPDQPPRYSSRTWQAEAWQRERERELRATENHPGIAARRSTAHHAS
jgi:hypothetical protein